MVRPEQMLWPRNQRIEAWQMEVRWEFPEAQTRSECTVWTREWLPATLGALGTPVPVPIWWENETQKDSGACWSHPARKYQRCYSSTALLLFGPMLNPYVFCWLATGDGKGSVVQWKVRASRAPETQLLPLISYWALVAWGHRFSCLGCLGAGRALICWALVMLPVLWGHWEIHCGLLL